MEKVFSEHFWSSDRILLLVVFIVGFVLGVFAMDFYVNFIEGSSNSDYNSMLEINQRLSGRNDQLFSCLLRNKVEPEEC